MTAETGRSRRSADTHETRERSRNVARPKPGPQFMVRLQTGEKISGRPDQGEQQRLAETIGARLRELRLEHGLSVRDLERRSGVNRSTISRLERGLRRPRMSVLGWLAWGLAGPDGAEPVKQELCNVAGDLVVAESRWSERSHARRAWRQAQAGGLKLPNQLVAPYIVGILGGMLPGEMDKLRQVQDAARSSDRPWPEHLAVSTEAFLLADELDQASLAELRNLGRGITAEEKAARERAARKRVRQLRAELGLTGVRKPRPKHIPWKPPEYTRRTR
jgi:DNA-binding XRE family transcriptional regulator